MDSLIKRGDIFYADLSPVVGSEQGGTRPVLIVQNDTGNRHSPTVIAAAITSQTGKARLPTHINIAGGSVGLSKDSVILLEQIRTIDKRRLREHMGRLAGALGALVGAGISQIARHDLIGAPADVEHALARDDQMDEVVVPDAGTPGLPRSTALQTAVEDGQLDVVGVVLLERLLVDVCHCGSLLPVGSIA